MALFNYTIISLQYLTKTHALLLCAPSDTVLNYEAGQYLEIAYPNGQFMPFSIANAPNKDGVLELHIRIVPDDVETQRFITTLKITRELCFRGPFGRCQFSNKSERLLLLAAGTGFAPAKAMIEQLINRNSDQSCHLYWTVKQPGDFYLADLPRQWQQRLTNFCFSFICTQSETSYRSNILAAISEDFLTLSNATVYVFGPMALAKDALTNLATLGLTKENFYCDVL